jgi:ABC-type glycerol-3-phosphate transport system substrate-binding protein
MAVKEFNEKNKGRIKIEARYMEWSEYNIAIQAAVSSGDLPDIFISPQGTDIRTIVSNGWIQPLDGLVSENWKKRFNPDGFAEGINVIDGKTYTWPLYGPNLVQILYYNKDVLKNVGLDPEKPPKTWEELRTMAKQVTAKGYGNVFGLVFGGAQFDATRLIKGLAAGISPMDADGFNYKTGKYSYDSKAFKDSFNFVLALKDDGSILPSSYTLKEAEAGVLFGEGKVAFLVQPRYRMAQIKRDTPNAKFGMSYIPTPTGQKPVYFGILAQPSGYMVSKETKHPKEAGEFIEEAFGSSKFYEQFLRTGIGLTPIDNVNKNRSFYPYPEFETLVQLTNNLLRTRPDFAIRNPETWKVISNMGSIQQPKIKPDYKEIVSLILSGARKDVDVLLKEYNDKLNNGLNEAIEKANKEGVKVSENDFKFPNWDGAKDYTEKDYSELN